MLSNQSVLRCFVFTLYFDKVLAAPWDGWMGGTFKNDRKIYNFCNIVTSQGDLNYFFQNKALFGSIRLNCFKLLQYITYIIQKLLKNSPKSRELSTI